MVAKIFSLSVCLSVCHNVISVVTCGNVTCIVVSVLLENRARAHFYCARFNHLKLLSTGGQSVYNEVDFTAYARMRLHVNVLLFFFLESQLVLTFDKDLITARI